MAPDSALCRVGKLCVHRVTLGVTGFPVVTIAAPLNVTAAFSVALWADFPLEGSHLMFSLCRRCAQGCRSWALVGQPRRQRVSRAGLMTALKPSQGEGNPEAGCLDSSRRLGILGCGEGCLSVVTDVGQLFSNLDLFSSVHQLLLHSERFSQGEEHVVDQVGSFRCAIEREPSEYMSTGKMQPA